MTDEPGPPPDPDEGRAKAREARVTIELIRRYQKGDQAALHVLLERYQERVLGMVRIKMGAWVRQRVQSADIVQETLLAAFEDFDDFEMRDDSALIRWLYKVAENQVKRAVDHHSADMRNPDREIALEAPKGPGTSSVLKLDLEDSGPRSPEIAERTEARAIVERCVAELPGDYREIILQRDYIGSSWDAIAESMGRSKGAVQMLHQRARKALAEAARRRAGG